MQHTNDQINSDFHPQDGFFFSTQLYWPGQQQIRTTQPDSRTETEAGAAAAEKVWQYVPPMRMSANHNPRDIAQNLKDMLSLVNIVATETNVNPKYDMQYTLPKTQ